LRCASFPAALEAYEDLTAPDVLELLGRVPDPASAAGLSRSQITAALKRARRRQAEDEAATIAAALRTAHLAQPPAVAAAYAATVRSLASVITAFNAEIAAMEEQVNECFGQARDAEIYWSKPGLDQSRRPGSSESSVTTSTATPPPGTARTTPAPAPISRASGKQKIVLTRFIRDGRLVDALH
jgi:hypothetical protein